MIKQAVRTNRIFILLTCMLLAGLQTACPWDDPPSPPKLPAPAPPSVSAPSPEPDPGVPVVGPTVTQVTFERTSSTASTLGIRDAGGADHAYSYSTAADGNAALRVAGLPSAQWNDNGAAGDTVDFTLTTKAAAANALSATNLQLVALNRATTGFDVKFEPFGSTTAGDEVLVAFAATRYDEAKRLALVLQGAESAPARLTLSQAAGTPTLGVSFRLQ